MHQRLPTGTVTFLFTDIEGSTRLLGELGEGYVAVLAEHHRSLREVWAAHHGIEVDTAGDAFFVAFARASDALAAAEAGQAALAGGPVRVRMGVHTGEPLLTETGYVGMDVHRAARIAAVAHGGQVVISRSTFDLAAPDARDLGNHRLKDLSAPERLYQLGKGEFPQLRSLHRTNLPVQPSRLVGREHELRAVVAALEAHRIVTLTGPGGSGKTRLALHAAAEVAERFPDGVWWVSLAAIRDAALVLPAIATAVGAQADLASHLAGKRMLVLLDNVEQVIDCAADIAGLAESTTSRIVVTSRQPLRVDGEAEIDVPPLPPDDAVALFVERARSIDSSFAADEHVPAICARLDGLPLAIELAAARTRVLSSRAILERLSKRLPLLTGGRRDAPERQRTLHATIAWTYDLLDEGERMLFARLGVFHGGWALHAGEAVCDASLDVLESLVEKSLVRRSGERYFMLETIREFAGDVLGDDEDLLLGHAQWFQQLVETLEPQLRASNQAHALAIFAAELDNVRAALAFARATERHELEGSLAGACWYFWMWTGSYVEGREALLSAAHGPGLSPAVRARVLEGLSAMLSAVADYPAATASGEEALEIRRSLGETDGVLRALINASLAYGRGGDLRRGALLLEEARALASESGNTWMEAIALINLGSGALIDADFGSAESYLRPAVALASSLEDRFVAAAAETNLAAALIVQDKREEAVALYRRACTVWRELGNPEGQIWCLEGFALAAAEGDPEAAARIGGASLRACEEVPYVLPAQEQAWRERRRARVADQLDPARIDELEREGRKMDLAESVDYALESVR